MARTTNQSTAYRLQNQDLMSLVAIARAFLVFLLKPAQLKSLSDTCSRAQAIAAATRPGVSEQPFTNTSGTTRLGTYPQMAAPTQALGCTPTRGTGWPCLGAHELGLLPDQRATPKKTSYSHRQRSFVLSRKYPEQLAVPICELLTRTRRQGDTIQTKPC